MVVLLNAVRMAVLELSRNVTRTALTSLGILIGVAAVIAMVGLGQGATSSIQGDLASLGVNMLMVDSGTGGGPGSRTPAPALTLADADAIADQVPHVAAVAPTLNSPVVAVVGDHDWNTSVIGTNRQWLDVMGRALADGRAFTDGEERSGAGVCVVGQTISEELLGDTPPIGETLRLGKVTCEIIGVLEAEGQNTFGMDQDDLVIMPIRAVQRRLAGTSDIGTIFVSADAPETMNAVSRDLDALMRERRGVRSDASLNFSVRDTREMAAMVGNITGILTTFLAAVAGVSLLVGGIGIMNIMLVSVTERTREIGIRMAIGALESDVMTQFLVEAVVLSTFGGVMGILVGLAGTAVGAMAIGIPFVVDPLIIILAMGFSGLMGVAFGWWPARRAARLEPIDALRHG